MKFCRLENLGNPPRLACDGHRQEQPTSPVLARVETEHPANSPEEPGIDQQDGAESGAVGAAGGAIDRDLAEIVSEWPNLSAMTRASLLAIVRIAKE
jgi:hypothetical protein